MSESWNTAVRLATTSTYGFHIVAGAFRERICPSRSRVTVSPKAKLSVDEKALRRYISLLAGQARSMASILGQRLAVGAGRMSAIVLHPTGVFGPTPI